MMLDEFRREMTAYRNSVNDEARSQKEPIFTLERLYALYNKFDQSEREMADVVIADWLSSTDGGFRFDAIAMIREFKIVSAIPALGKLAARLATSLGPSAPYEFVKVSGLIDYLNTSGG